MPRAPLPTPGPPNAGVAGRPAIPKTLWSAASLVLAEGLVLVVLGVAELVALTGERVIMGLSTTVFFVGFGAALVVCAWGLTRLWSWVRGPVVLTQLIQLGLAWSFRGGETGALALALTVPAVLVLVLVLLPSSTVLLVDDDQ